MNWKEKALRAAAIAALLEADWAGRFGKRENARAFVAAILADIFKAEISPDACSRVAEAVVASIREKRRTDLTLKYDEGSIQSIMSLLKEALDAEQGEQAEAVAQDA